MRRGLSLTLRFLAPSVALLGCTLPELNPTGKACPCPEPEFVCDDASKTCVPAGASASGTGASAASTSSATGSGGGGAGVCADLCGTPGCGTCPPAEVAAVDGYDIDKYEVTAAHYQAFLDASPDTANQPSFCNWNQTFDPNTADPMCGSSAPDVVNFPNRPIVCIDWCDARAYCAWVGRHLCGRIGGGVLLQEKTGDPAMSQWHHACTNAGTLAYPYGNTFEVNFCNTANSGLSGGTPVDVGMATDCQGGFQGVFDMSGNVEEWEDACASGPNPNDASDDGCPLRGGAFWTDETESRCDSLKYTSHRNTVSGDWGFRCCGGD